VFDDVYLPAVLEHVVVAVVQFPEERGDGLVLKREVLAVEDDPLLVGLGKADAILEDGLEGGAVGVAFGIARSVVSHTDTLTATSKTVPATASGRAPITVAGHTL